MFDALLHALRLSAQERAAAALDLHLVAAGLRTGALLPRFDAHAHCASLPPQSPPLLLATLPGGNTLLLHAGLVARKRAALRQALAQGCSPGALEAACRSARVVLPMPVRLADASALPEDELPPWVQRHAALLAGLAPCSGSGGSSSDEEAGGGRAGGWEVVARSGAHAALRLEASASACPVALTGLLLDYPIVYDMLGCEQHALGSCQLHVWRAGPAIAFSLPAALSPCPAARAALELWQALLAERAAAAGLAPLAITCTPENRTHVIV